MIGTRGLPPKDSPEGQDAEKRYRNREFNYLIREYGYSSIASLQGAFRKLYGVCLGERRLPQDSLPEDVIFSLPPKTVHKNQSVKEGSTSTLMTMRCQGTMAVMQDAHHPFQDKVVLQIIREFLKDLQPLYLAIPGDWWDLYQLSRFDKNPDRIEQLQADIDQGVRTLYLIRKDLPDTQIVLIDGNHEDRLRKYIWRNRSELSRLRCFEPDELFGLIDLEIDRVPRHQILAINGVFNIEHGDVVSKHSGWTAKAMFERRGGCGICGHSHRGGSYYKHDNDYWGWWENFCTCSLYPEWVKNPNWMHGFSLVHFIKNRFWVEQIPIIKNTFMYGGRLYKTEEKGVVTASSKR